MICPIYINLFIRSVSPSGIPSGNLLQAIENGPFLVDLPIENGDFPWLC